MVIMKMVVIMVAVMIVVVMVVVMMVVTSNDNGGGNYSGGNDGSDDGSDDIDGDGGYDGDGNDDGYGNDYNLPHVVVVMIRGVTIQFAHDTIRISIQQPRYDSYLDSRYGGSKLSNMFWWTSGVLYSIVVMINELTELENRVTDYNSTTSETLEHCC